VAKISREVSLTACVIGWSHLQFQLAKDVSIESLITAAASAALAHAEIGPDEVDEVFLGHFNAGFSEQSFTAALALQADPGLRFKPATRTENACATGTAAIHGAIRSIEARRANRVLVIGVEQMSRASPTEAARNLLRASYLPEDGSESAGFAGVFGKIASAYFQAYGDQSDALARIAAKNHRNGLDNPYAQIRKDLGFEFCRTASDRNPFIAGPLKRTDCSPISDGAAALVLADADLAYNSRRAIAFRSAIHVQDFLPRANRDILAFEGCRIAWRRAFQEARVELADLSFVETHDCFTIAELIEYEAMGLCAPGRGFEAALDGTTERNGRLPVNPSGGLKSKGHPIGATGVSMHALAAMQLCDAAGGMQVPSAKLGAVFNMGGVAVANYVSILERIK
jgi:acetyl-CoA C-acetyltransferase